MFSNQLRKNVNFQRRVDNAAKTQNSSNIITLRSGTSEKIKKMIKMDFALYFITDRKLSVKGVLTDVKEALEAGVNIIQYREKELTTKQMYEEGLKIQKLCHEHHAKYIVNDRIDIALATNADGVHIGQNDLPLHVVRTLLPNKIIGVSCTTVDEAIKAAKEGANYLGVGPIYRTNTKKDAGMALGPETIKKIKTRVKIPIVAIGGITIYNVREVIEAGADSIAAISAIVGNHTGKNVSAFIKEIKKWRKLTTSQ